MAMKVGWTSNFHDTTPPRRGMGEFLVREINTTSNRDTIKRLTGAGIRSAVAQAT